VPRGSKAGDDFKSGKGASVPPVVSSVYGSGAVKNAKQKPKPQPKAKLQGPHGRQAGSAGLPAATAAAAAAAEAVSHVFSSATKAGHHPSHPAAEAASGASVSERTGSVRATSNGSDPAEQSVRDQEWQAEPPSLMQQLLSSQQQHEGSQPAVLALLYREDAPCPPKQPVLAHLSSALGDFEKAHEGGGLRLAADLLTMMSARLCRPACIRQAGSLGGCEHHFWGRSCSEGLHPVK
jgi:hypothetical protein